MSESIVNAIQLIGLPALVLIGICWAAWKWIPVVAGWCAGIVSWAQTIVERLTAANETTAKAVTELTIADRRQTIVGESLQHGQRRIARMVILAVPEDKRAEAERHLDEIERLLGDANQ